MDIQEFKSYYRSCMLIDIKKLSEKAQIPTRATDHAAGYDLYSAQDAVIDVQERQLIKTDISISIPEGYYGRIAPRSGLALKFGVDVMAGVIDSDYRGEIGVILLNTSKTVPFLIRAGDRIAQIIFEKYHTAEFRELTELKSSVRSSGGFGSTGI